MEDVFSHDGNTWGSLVGSIQVKEVSTTDDTDDTDFSKSDDEFDFIQWQAVLVAVDPWNPCHPWFN
jgi:hypothetical protein